MVKFLLKRPIAVFMAFLAFVIIGIVTYFTLPVSLLPSIAIPHITVQIDGDNTGARELENNVTAIVRRQLLQIGGLREIKSETRDGIGIIQLEFEYGVNTDLAFIEVNEKIDAAMNSFPTGTQRPKAIKASATDIPVLYLNMTLKDEDEFGEVDEEKFLEMCELADNVVRRRIEQLPEIAMADITGIPGRILQIIPDANYMKMSGITLEDIENCLTENNVEPNAMTVRDGYYEYSIHISNQLSTPEDVKAIYIRKGEKLIQLGDFCEVKIVPKSENGYSFSDGKRAVTLAIIKQSDENMNKMKDALRKTTEYFASIYPDIEFTENRNQTELLDYTIDNLVQNLILGFILVFICTAIFMGEARSSIIIGVSIIVAIIITFLVFYLFHVSLNIISLSGLILAVGMMIDNSVIVTENITQYRQRGYTLMRSCDLGTSEMITPMLSSSLTTIAVFVPLIFMSGIAGAIFTDQAFSITAGLGVSYIVGIMLLPVLYLICYRAGGIKRARKIRISNKGLRLSDKINIRMDNIYNKVIDWVFEHKIVCITFIGLILPLCAIMFKVLDVERMPQIDQNEMIVKIEWNENINANENTRRVNSILSEINDDLVQHAAYVGVQDFLLNSGNELSPSESEIYIKTENPSQIEKLHKRIAEIISTKYPLAVAEYNPPENIFEKIFASDEAPLEARIYPANKSLNPGAESILNMESELRDVTGKSIEETPMRDVMNIVVNREKLLLYRIDYNEVSRLLKTALKSNTVSTLRSYQQYLPIGIANDEQSIESILANTMIKTRPDEDGIVSEMPLSSFVELKKSRDLKSITSGKDGEYIPVSFYDTDKKVEGLIDKIRTTVQESKEWEVDFTGSIFSNKKMMTEMIIILIISVLLMYFILCAQFESFIQPLIVLIEIPLDTAFALLTLWIFGHTLNLMSAIGIVVTCGIVVNDSILKIDAINELRKEGMPLSDAIHTAGRRRLRAIIMTSLTTILAMVPMLFSSDMGSELQRPLAIAMIGSMIVGTIISIFLIPLIYWLIYRKKDKKMHYNIEMQS